MLREIFDKIVRNAADEPAAKRLMQDDNERRREEARRTCKRLGIKLACVSCDSLYVVEHNAHGLTFECLSCDNEWEPKEIR